MLEPLIILWIFWELVPNQSIGAGARTSFLPKETVVIFVNLCVEESWSMHPSGLFCTCNHFFATHTSDSVNLPSWCVFREWTNSDPSSVWLPSSHHHFCWSETNYPKIPLLSDKLLKWNPFLALPSLPDLPFLLFLI